MQRNANTKIEIFCEFLFATLSGHARPMAEALNGEAPMNSETEVTNMESAVYQSKEDRPQKIPSWVKVTAVTGASVLAGVLAAAWIYRKSIARLQNPEETNEYSNFNISDRETDDEN
jgi:hypothetical protein